MVSRAPSHKELPPIPTRALSQPKHDLAYVLEVGFPLCLMCAIPLRHDLSILRQLDDGVVLGECLLVILSLALKLLLQRLQGTRRHASHSANELVVFRLALRLLPLHEHLALEHLISRILNERLPQVAYPILNLLLEGRALGIVLGDVLQSPTTSHCDLSLQDLVCEDMGATNLTRRIHSILVELNLARRGVRSLYELVLVVRSFLCFNFHHRSISNRYPIQFRLLRQILNRHPLGFSLSRLVYGYPCAPLLIACLFYFTSILYSQIHHRYISPHRRDRQPCPQMEPNLDRHQGVAN